MDDVLDRLRARLDQLGPQEQGWDERRTLSDAIQEIERLREEFADAVSMPLGYMDSGGYD